MSTYKLSIALVVLLVLAGAFLAYQSWVPGKPTADESNGLEQKTNTLNVVKTAASSTPSQDMTTYKDTTLGISFMYPKSWGTVDEHQFSAQEAGHYQFVFSNATAADPFMVYKEKTENHIQRDGYWGDWTDSDPFADSQLCSFSGVTCTVATDTQVVTAVASEPGWVTCDVPKTVSVAPVTYYFVPSKNPATQKWVVFRDGAIVNADCTNHSLSKAEQFRNMIDSIQYLP